MVKEEDAMNLEGGCWICERQEKELGWKYDKIMFKMLKDIWLLSGEYFYFWIISDNINCNDTIWDYIEFVYHLLTSMRLIESYKEKHYFTRENMPSKMMLKDILWVTRDPEDPDDRREY